MSDVVDAGGGPIDRVINGTKVTFAELFFTDKQELIRAYRTKLREELEQDMESSGLTEEQRYSERREFSSRKIGDLQWAEFFMDDAGKYAILEASVKKAGGDLSILSRINLDSDSITALCAAITHTKLKSKDEKGNNQNPSTPAPTKGYGQE